MGIISDRKRSMLQQNGCLYLLVNIVFLVPVFLFTQFSDALTVVFDRIPEPLGMLFLIYWIPVILYFVFGLPYLHFAAELVFLIYAVWKLIKEKNAKFFAVILVLSAFSVALNLYWLKHGLSYVVV